jgi:hypothetical protein
MLKQNSEFKTQFLILKLLIWVDLEMQLICE